MAQRPGPLRRPALDPCDRTVHHPEALADLPRVRLWLFKPFSVGWYAADEEGRLYRIKELYGCTGRPNEGLRIDPVEQARRIREAEQNDPLLRGRVIHGIADPAIFDESRGESIAAMMERSPNFLRWSPATTPGLRARCSSTTG